VRCRQIAVGTQSAPLGEIYEYRPAHRSVPSTNGERWLALRRALLVVMGASRCSTRMGSQRPCPMAILTRRLIIASDATAAADDFIAAMAKHRYFARETDPPRV
jgi:hypothetical protein